MTAPGIPQLRWPPSIEEHPDGTRTIREVEQDSGADIDGSALLLCDLRRGQLSWAGDVGISDPLGASDPDAAAEVIETELRRLEPRPAGGIHVRVVPQPDGSRRIRLKVLS
jgi:hypothetical protein